MAAEVRDRAGLAMAARIAAIPGGYVLASLVCACLARMLPADRVEAVVVSMLLSFALYAVILLWVFAARSVLRLWLWMGGGCALSGLMLAVSLWSEGRL